MFSPEFLAPGPILFLSLPADLVCEHACPNWRNHLPSFLGDPERGLIRHRCLDMMREWYGAAKYVTFSEFREQNYNNNYHNDHGHGARDVSIVRVAWDFLRADNTKLHDAFYPISLFIVLPLMVLALRYIKHRLCLPHFSAVGRRIGRATHGAEWEAKNEERIYKFGEYVFRLCFHSLISVYGLYYLCYVHADWWRDTNVMFAEGLVQQDIENPMIWYYFIQTAYNVEALLNIFELSFTFRNPWKHGVGWGKCIDWASTVRGDFREMFIHHLATNMLVMLSSSFQLTRAGAVVLFLHDVSDVPVDLSKLANFVKWKKTTIVCFVTMMVVWFVTRLVLLPYVPGYSIVFQCPQLLEEPIHMEPSLLYSVYWIFCSLCGLMFVLHLSWFGMFLQMGYVLLSKGEAHDLSEHKKGEMDATGNGMVNGMVNGNEANGNGDSYPSKGATGNGTNDHSNGNSHLSKKTK
jgi:hypothetical protein